MLQRNQKTTQSIEAEDDLNSEFCILEVESQWVDDVDKIRMSTVELG